MSTPRSWLLVLFTASLFSSSPLSAQATAAQPEVPSIALQTRLTAMYGQMLDGLRTRDTVALRGVLSRAYLFAPGDSGLVLNRAGRFQAVMDTADHNDVLRLEGCDFDPGTPRRVEALCRVDQRGRYSGESWHLAVESRVTFARAEDGQWVIESTQVQVRSQAKQP